MSEIKKDVLDDRISECCRNKNTAEKGNALESKAQDSKSCCSASRDSKEGLGHGLLYGIIPHIGCIGFIMGSVLGATFLTSMFKPLLLSPYFFHILIVISIGFATLSSVLYLRKHNHFSFDGAMKRWGYLLATYGMTIGVNLLMFFVVFPALTGITYAGQTNQQSTAATSQATTSQFTPPTMNNISSSTKDALQTLYLQVSIPCPGHAGLIISELKTLPGVKNVRFISPNKFLVSYDASTTTKDEIMGFKIFNTYPAKEAQ